MRENIRVAKRARLDAVKKRQALAEIEQLGEVRNGVQKPPVSPPGTGYSVPTYDPTARCWKSYPEDDGDVNDSHWKAWSVDLRQWLTRDAYGQGKLSRFGYHLPVVHLLTLPQVYPPTESAHEQDENQDRTFSAPLPEPGISRRSTVGSAISKTVISFRNFARRLTPPKP